MKIDSLNSQALERCAQRVERYVLTIGHTTMRAPSGSFSGGRLKGDE